MSAEAVLVLSFLVCGLIWLWFGSHLSENSPAKWTAIMLGLIFILASVAVAGIIVGEMIPHE